MSVATGARSAGPGTPLPWPDVLLSAIACVSWALTGMAATAALGLRLLGADSAGSLGPMTAAVVALGAGGTVTPSGDVSAFGLHGAEADTALRITPLGVGLAGALLLSWFFLRSLRTAGVGIAPAELLARAGAVVALFVAMLGGLAWAGHDVVTIDGGSLDLGGLPGGSGGGGPGDPGIPGLGGLGDLGGLLPGNIGRLVDARAAVGFRVDTTPTLLGGLVWSAGTLLIALLASRRAPLPRGWSAGHRAVRPAVSALVTVVLVAVVAGLAAAGYAAIGDPHPGRVAGAALLGAPNGVWLGVPIGLLVPWDGRATGVLATLLPDPLDRLLGGDAGRPVTLARLAGLDGRVWLLGAAAALTMLLAGALTAVRTPVAGDAGAGTVRGRGTGRFAGRCALRLGVTTAVALPLLAWLTDVSVNASLSVLGFDAFGAGIELHGHLGAAVLLGAVWGAGAGAAGALLATATGTAGRRAAPPAPGDGEILKDAGGGRGPAPGAGTGGPGSVRSGVRSEVPTDIRHGPAPRTDALPGVPSGPGLRPDGSPGIRSGSGIRPDDSPGIRPGAPPGSGSGLRSDAPSADDGTEGRHPAGQAGPYSPGTPYRPPNPATNPYLRLPAEPPEPEDARPPREDTTRPAPRTPQENGPPQAPRSPHGERPPRRDRSPDEDRDRRRAWTAQRQRASSTPDTSCGATVEDMSGAPTVAGFVAPPPRPPGRRPRPRSGMWPPPPPPPPPVPPTPSDAPAPATPPAQGAQDEGPPPPPSGRSPSG